MSREQAVAEYGEPGMARRWGITLADVLLIDIDSPRSMRAFCRLAHTLEGIVPLGVAKTPRGWHVYLDCPGWNQRAVNTWMRRWLGDWHGSDESRIGWDGYLLDVRTGPYRYAVWPGECATDPDRRWSTEDEFKAQMVWGRWGMREKDLAPMDGAPWRTEMTDAVRQEIQAAEVPLAPRRPVSTGPISAATTMADLERWCEKLAAMGPDTGRNNMLNQIAFYQGAAAIAAGHDPITVQVQLAAAAAACGCPGAEATISSGLLSGGGRFARAS